MISVLANSLLLIILLYLISFFSTGQVEDSEITSRCLLVVCKIACHAILCFFSVVLIL
uniref:Uncharacterized protein n=1 Tax=Setaria viridis TaxID=4556 RepID=A0A4U6VXB3_SETVI|nr:hypothetical protein SEVIR_2G263833v2 [Setaria viridis]